MMLVFKWILNFLIISLDNWSLNSNFSKTAKILLTIHSNNWIRNPIQYLVNLTAVLILPGRIRSSSKNKNPRKLIVKTLPI